MPPKKRTKRRGSQETERMSTRARSPEVDELSFVPETQQAELGRHSKNRIQVMRIHKLLQLLHRRARAQARADKRSKKPPVRFSPEQEQKLVDFLRDNEIPYNKRLMDYKDGSKKEVVWAKFCEENNLDKDACQKWFQSQRTLFGKVTHMKSSQGEPQLTERQKWTRDNFDFLRDHIVCHLTAKSEFRAPKGCASQASAGASSSSRRETVHMVPFQDTSLPESTCDPSEISHLDTHTPMTRSRAVSVTSSLADSDLQAALAESQGG